MTIFEQIFFRLTDLIGKGIAINAGNWGFGSEENF
jgi:hypothetical protein